MTTSPSSSKRSVPERPRSCPSRTPPAGLTGPCRHPSVHLQCAHGATHPRPAGTHDPLRPPRRAWSGRAHVVRGLARPPIWRRISLSESDDPTAGPDWSGRRWPATRTRCGRAVRDRTSWEKLVETVRRGPPLLLRPFDGPMNTVEFFIHVEDVRRAQDGWEPRPISPELADALWARVGPGRDGEEGPRHHRHHLAGTGRQGARHRAAPHPGGRPGRAHHVRRRSPSGRPGSRSAATRSSPPSCVPRPSGCDCRSLLWRGWRLYALVSRDRAWCDLLRSHQTSSRRKWQGECHPTGSHGRF